ncbi:MAG TPA: anthranilate phosphoribosyltransferase, partial [Actinomycetota bacterium]|nr:anthranilate phosphoribosyltransferase [Actinomycetota bacterium]
VHTLGRLGSKHVLAFHGDKGLDELSTSGPSQVYELVEGEVREWTIDPEELGLPVSSLEHVAGGTADENAGMIRDVLAGTAGPHRDIVLLNAAAGLVAAGRSEDMAAGLKAAADAVDSGEAEGRLHLLVAASTGA